MSAPWKSLGFCIALLVLSGCSSSHCRTTKKVIPPTGPTNSAKKATQSASDKPTTKHKTPTVRVYKYDGTKQCSKGKEITLDVMAEELKSLNVFAKEKLSDGLMRIQVCGQPTGMANVYEVPAKELEKAKNLGFKLWDFK